MPKTHESDLEQHVLDHLEELGYAYKHGDAFDPEVAPAQRPNYHAAILAQRRDTLLPKLLSGELRIKNAEKFLETKA